MGRVLAGVSESLRSIDVSLAAEIYSRRVQDGRQKRCETVYGRTQKWFSKCLDMFDKRIAGEALLTIIFFKHEKERDQIREKDGRDEFH